MEMESLNVHIVMVRKEKQKGAIIVRERVVLAATAVIVAEGLNRGESLC